MSDYETMQRKRNFAVGLFVIGAIVALVWLIFKFGDLPVKVSTLTSYDIWVQFPVAQGVQQNTPVRFCGYQIGRVTHIMPPAMLKDQKTGQFYHQATVVLSIEKKYTDIPSNVDVKLMTRGLGSSYVELVPDPDRTPVPLDPNRPETAWLGPNLPPLQGATGVASEFFPQEVQDKLSLMVDAMLETINNVNMIVGDPNNRLNINASLEKLASAAQKANETLDEFKGLAAKGTQTLENADGNFDKLFASVIQTSEELNKGMSDLRVVLTKVNDGEGTAGRLLNDGRLYENMVDSTQRLELLLEEMQKFMAASRDRGLPIKLK